MTTQQTERDALRGQKPVATLHQDGDWIWNGVKPHEASYIGWTLKVFAAPVAPRLY